MRVTAGTWGGRTADERRAERRRRMIDAATQMWSENGWAAVTMRGVCARTALNDRYFYEAFGDRDTLLGAVWDSVRDETLALLLDVLDDHAAEKPVEILRAAITAVVERISADPGLAQIVLGHHAGSETLEDRRASALQDATNLIVAAARPHLLPDVDETALRMDVLVGVGGFYELLVAWRAGILDTTPDQIVSHASRLGATLGAQYLKP